jgi:hypothetical protein
MKRLGLFLAAPAVSLVLLGLYSKALYGSFNPAVISPEKNFFAIPLKFKIETLLSFFLDQRDGLLVYAPVFLLIFLVGKKEIRGNIRDFFLLAALFLSYILFHAFTTVRGAYSPAGRPSLFVMWIMAIFLAAYYRHSRPGIFKSLFRWLAGLTVFATVWFFYYPLFLYQPVTREVSQRASSWLLFMSSEAADLPSFFPSFLKKENAAWLPNRVWLALIAVGILSYYAGSSWTLWRKAARILYPLLGLALLFLVCYFPHVRLQTRYASAGLSFFCNSRNFVFRQDMNAFRVLAGQDYDLFFEMKGSAADRLNLVFFNGGDAAIRVRNGKKNLMDVQRGRQSRLSLSLGGLGNFSLAGRQLVHIGLETTALARNAAFWLKLE